MVVPLKRKTQIEIGLPIWAEVRYFATKNGISNNAALEALLSKALKNSNVKNKETEMLAGENDLAIHPPAASSEVQSVGILMNLTKLYALDAYKDCSGMGCPNPGRIVLEIRYIKKQGCNSCAESLLQNRKGESMMYNCIEGVKRIRSLQSAQVGGHGQIAAVEDTSVGADAIRR